MAIRGFGILNADRNVGITTHIAIFGAAFGAVDNDMRPIEITDSLLRELKDHVASRQVSQGIALLDAHARLLTSLDPEQPHAAALAGYVAQWVDIGYRDPEVLRQLLERFPTAMRSRLPVGDYLQLRMAEGLYSLLRDEPDDAVRLLTPFDPVVWDRRRFELLWEWPYRFEAYTPARLRKFGYYALPLLCRDRVIGWGNVEMRHGELHAAFGYVRTRPRDRAFTRALAMEIDRMRAFLGGGAR